MIGKTTNRIEAVIFDMDGVIIDSEGLWKRAEYEVFSSVGVHLSEELCKLTQSMTTSEVTRFWFDRHPWQNKSMSEIENGVIERVADLIKKEGTAIPGVGQLILHLKREGYKTGLATNSPSALIQVVLEKLALTDCFDAVCSAEYETEGKPNPAVYLSVIRKLKLKPQSCVAIEDSYSGIMAAKNAGMKTIALLDHTPENPIHEIADFGIGRLDEFDFSFLS